MADGLGMAGDIATIVGGTITAGQVTYSTVKAVRKRRRNKRRLAAIQEAVAEIRADAGRIQTFAPHDVRAEALRATEEELSTRVFQRRAEFQLRTAARRELIARAQRESLEKMGDLLSGDDSEAAESLRAALRPTVSEALADGSLRNGKGTIKRWRVARAATRPRRSGAALGQRSDESVTTYITHNVTGWAEPTAGSRFRIWVGPAILAVGIALRVAA